VHLNLRISTDCHSEFISSQAQISCLTVTSWPSPSQDFFSPVACLDASTPTGLFTPWYGAFAVILARAQQEKCQDHKQI
jgi:hypothetical protein